MQTANNPVVILDQFKSFGVLAAFTLKPFNLNFRNQSQQEFRKALSEFGRIAGFPLERACFFNQVHGAHAIAVGEGSTGSCSVPTNEFLAAADAGYTNLTQTPILIFTADCLPVFISDEQGEVVALLHVGWRGAEAGIIPETLAKICSYSNSSPSGLVGILGPAIRSCCYEVGPEFRDKFGSFLEMRDGRQFLNLAEFAKAELVKFGINRKQLLDTEICTCCDHRFHSYRREDQAAGRMASVIMKIGA